MSDVFVQFRYSYGRARAAEAINVTAPNLFREQFVVECLWDCEPKTRQLAAETAPPGKADVSARLRRLAADPWEDDDVRAEAKRRAPPE